MLHIIDISNAANPKVVESVAFKDRQLYCLKYRGGYILASDTNSLLTIDVSPRSLTKIVQTTTLPLTLCEIQTTSDYAITIGFSGAAILDIKQPEVPRIVSVIDTPFG